jgi:hypothetical protein
MGAAWTLGPHRVSFEAPDLLRVVPMGLLDLKLVEDMKALALELQARYPVLYLVSDLRQCTGMEPELREALAQNPDRSPFAGMAVFGASFALRALSNSLSRAARLRDSPDRKPFALVDTEAEARAWISSWREATGVLKTG